MHTKHASEESGVAWGWCVRVYLCICAVRCGAAEPRVRPTGSLRCMCGFHEAPRADPACSHLLFGVVFFQCSVCARVIPADVYVSCVTGPASLRSGAVRGDACGLSVEWTERVGSGDVRFKNSKRKSPAPVRARLGRATNKLLLVPATSLVLGAHAPRAYRIARLSIYHSYLLTTLYGLYCARAALDEAAPVCG